MPSADPADTLAESTDHLTGFGARRGDLNRGFLREEDPRRDSPYMMLFEDPYQHGGFVSRPRHPIDHER